MLSNQWGPALNTIEALALENVKIVGSVPQQNSMKMGVVKSNSMLLSIFDKGVASLTEQEKIGFYRKWLNVEVENQMLNRTTVLRIIFGFAIIVLFLLWRQFTLKRHAKKLKAFNKQLQHYSTVDHLTQVFNRRTIEKLLHTEIEKANLIESPLTLVIFDIDHFKNINDTFGHPAGDRVLKELAGHVSGSIRQTDHFGRWGGEEFIIILPGTDANGGLRLTENLSGSIERFDFGLEHQVTASFGIGQHQAKEEMDAFVLRVDACLFEAKQQGRNRIVQSSPDSAPKHEG